MGGFECSCHINSAGARLDMTAALQHDVYAAEDYRRLRDVGIPAARDGLRWHLIDRPEATILVVLDPHAGGGARRGHPGDLGPLPLRLAGRPGYLLRRHSSIASPASRGRQRACSANIRRVSGFYSPVNEISFFAWAATRDLMFPYAYGRDGELKRQLVRAAIAAVDAVRSVDPSRALDLSRAVDPQRAAAAAPPGTPSPPRAAKSSQFEAWDMLPGRVAPELGGDERYLDMSASTSTRPTSGRCPAAASCTGTPAPTIRAGSARTAAGRGLGALPPAARHRRDQPLRHRPRSVAGRSRAASAASRSTAASRSKALASTRSSTASIGRTLPTGTTAACGTCIPDSRGHYTRVLNEEYARSLQAAADLRRAPQLL